ncbi:MULTISPECIES: hypothetical protein [Pantoea]|uniref:hypothetical protein n=1 Tax=Pantoea TaxID=53335 RepID=UPI00057CA659|nr:MULTISPECIES: hypothetical protein [Pantoea]
MDFKFLVDEKYLSSLFEKIEDNHVEIEWFSNLGNIIPAHLGYVFITQNLLSKTFGGISNVDIFYPTKSKGRDIALKFHLAQQKYYKKYSLSDYTNGVIHDSPEDFPTFALNNNGVSLITKLNYESEVWWNNSFYIDTFNNEGDVLKCTRNILSNYYDCSNDEFRKIASLLFKDIYVHWSNRTKLEGFNLHPIPMKWIVDSLSYLNDFAVEDFRKNPSEFMGEALKKGIDLSPESTKTRKAARMMRERNIIINGSTICCEWHFKFSKINGGRIHFHLGYDVDEKTKDITLGLPIVGIFVQHLSIK